MKTVGFCTLGCKVNQYETEAMITLFKDSGYTIGDFEQICDIYVINTCTVTGTGDRKSRQMIHRAHALNPNAVVVVAGCYSQVSPDEIKKIDGVSLILGTNDRKNIVALTEQALREGGKEKLLAVTDIMKERKFEDLWISSYEDRTRAFMKIEEGCTEFCSYCIIPYARGPVRSRPLASIREEAKVLAANGYKEVVLTGIHLASYGRDLKDVSLIDAIRIVSDTDGIERIRLGSVEPRLLTDEFIAAISRLPKVCDHFHISLQSGCDATLQRMNRKYSAQMYEDCVLKLRKAYADPAITTDIIVGFPGESDTEFEQSLQFMRQISFSEAHIFPYSMRKGTKAAAMPEQIAKSVKEERSKQMIVLSENLHTNYINRFIGKPLSVLFERETADGYLEGHASNYIKVKCKADTALIHTVATVTVKECRKKEAIAELTE